MHIVTDGSYMPHVACFALGEGACVNMPVLALTAACVRACRVAVSSQAHLNLLMDAAEQVGCALDQMHCKNVAHLDIKVTAPSAAQLERLQ